MNKIKVHDTAELRAALNAGIDADTIHIVQSAEECDPDRRAAWEARMGPPADVLSAARAEGFEEGKLQAEQAAVLAERARIKAIEGLAIPGFEQEARAAISNGDTPERFAVKLIAATRDRGLTLGAIRRDAPQALPHARAPATEPKGRM